jgi:hypothetical protein
MNTNFYWLNLNISICAPIDVPVSIMCRRFVVYVATPGRLALADVLQLVDYNVTHDVTLFCVGSPIYTKYKTLARQK